MKNTLLALLSCVIALPLAAQMPDAKENPISAAGAANYMTVSSNILKSIEKMPADKFSFKATDGVYTFAEFAGHLADANYNYCTIVTGGEKKGGFKAKTDKAELVAAFTGARAECAKAWGSMTDKGLAEMKKMGNAERPVAMVLMGNSTHTWEHYGNMVTYLRMNGLVPPSSESKK